MTMGEKCLRTRARAYAIGSAHNRLIYSYSLVGFSFPPRTLNEFGKSLGRGEVGELRATWGVCSLFLWVLHVGVYIYHRISFDG